MARYTGPACRLCRRTGEKLFLKGERCYSPRCAVERRRKPPGEQTQRRRRVSEWGVQLREKQKASYTYGVLERQFRGYFDEARRKPGVTGQFLLQLLERRLDNVVYRLGFAHSRDQARQWVLHGHFLVNEHKVDIPSYLVREGDAVSWKESTKLKEFFKEIAAEAGRQTQTPWLSVDANTMTGKVVRLPGADDLQTIIDTRLIVEHYSR
ncbi:MAG: 30S ribosomal protein S4 [Chloroflexi bacterium]|nr:30S ribosomal protein S4 [Chloroflexota bacterium]